MRPSEDRLHHQLQRERLVDGIRNKGITDEKVLEAIGNVQRHLSYYVFFADIFEKGVLPINEPTM